MSQQKIQYTIRAAQPADFGPLAVLFKDCAFQESVIALGHQLDASINWQAYVGERSRRADTRIFLAETPNGIAGFVEARISDPGRASFKRRALRTAKRILRGEQTSLAKPRRVGVIEQVYIDESARNPYLGYDLFNAALDWFKSNNLPAAEGVVWSQNEDVMKMARYIGFKPTRIVFRKELV